MESGKMYDLATRKYGNNGVICVYDCMVDEFLFFDLSSRSGKDAEIGYVCEDAEYRPDKFVYCGTIIIKNKFTKLKFMKWEDVAEFAYKNGWIFVSDCETLKK